MLLPQETEDTFVLQDGLVTFLSAMCLDVLLLSEDVGELSLHAHLLLLLQSAAPCGVPDVACRIIHTCPLIKVSIWPQTRALSLSTAQAWCSLFFWHLTHNADKNIYCTAC